MCIRISNGLNGSLASYSSRTRSPFILTTFVTAATIFEGVLFILALGKGAMTAFEDYKSRESVSRVLYSVLLHDNVLYFFGYHTPSYAFPNCLSCASYSVTALLILNNLMVVVRASSAVRFIELLITLLNGRLRVRHVSLGSAMRAIYSLVVVNMRPKLTTPFTRPFQVVIGIMTCRMLLHLQKVVVHSRVSVSQGSSATSASSSGEEWPVFHMNRVSQSRAKSHTS